MMRNEAEGFMNTARGAGYDIRWNANPKGYKVSNVDVTLIAQRPKVGKYIPEMVTNIAGALGVSEDRVNVKATTEEGLGFTGRLEGISCHAVCLLEE